MEPGISAAGYDRDGSITGLEQNPANLLPVIMEVATAKRDQLQIFGDDFDTEDGTGVRDYVHVADLARAHVAALEKIQATKQNLVVNLGSETGISVLEMIKSAERISGRTVEHVTVGRRDGDPSKMVASSRLANEILDWQANESDVDSLVESTWKAYQGQIQLGEQ